MSEPTVKCPFCDEEDFDLIGLKMHLLRGWCDTFTNLKTPKGVIDLTRRGRKLKQAEEIERYREALEKIVSHSLVPTLFSDIAQRPLKQEEVKHDNL